MQKVERHLKCWLFSVSAGNHQFFQSVSKRTLKVSVCRLDLLWPVTGLILQNTYVVYTLHTLFCSSLSSSSSSVTTSTLPGGGTLSYYHPPSTPTAHTQPVMGLNMGPPYMQPSQHGAALGAYRAPTPPQTPTQSQVVWIFCDFVICCVLQK